MTAQDPRTTEPEADAAPETIEAVSSEALVEEVSIDGMCGVY